MILDDKRVVLRTTERPEFLLRFEELMRSYGDADRPGLVVQARPAPEAKLGIVDVDDEAFQRRFLAGSGGHDAWWHDDYGRCRRRSVAVVLGELATE